MNVLITGGYGFIGSHVAEQFYSKGHNIFILDNLSTGKNENVSVPHKFYQFNISDSRCSSIFEEVKFDVVVHLAAQVSVNFSIKSSLIDAEHNIIGLLNILVNSNKHQVKKFIFASSAAIYGDNPNLPLLESDAPAPISPYGISKCAGEMYCTHFNNHHLPTVCLRFSNVYGPRQTAQGEGGVVSIFMQDALVENNITIHGSGEQTRDFIFVKDVSDAIYYAATTSITGTYNVSTNERHSINEIASYIGNLAGNIHKNYSKPRKGDILHSQLSNEAIINQLNWKPSTSIIDGLKETYQWKKSSLKVTIK